MRMLALTKYGQQAASTRQRLMQYEPYLSKAGVDVEYAPLFDDRYVQRIATGQRTSFLNVAYAYASRLGRLASSRDFDAIWLHYEAFPFFPGVFERLVARSGKPLIVDYDDAIFHMYDAHRNSVVRRILGRKLETTIGQAAAVTVGNAYLRDYASRFNVNVHVFPTIVDTALYRQRESERSGPLVVGWIGSPSTWRYVEAVLPALLKEVQSAGAILRAVGAGPDARRFPDVESVDWSEATEIAAVQSMDVGIMPLPDEPWARGKCGYKLIQYMACGVPVIASPVGVNCEIVRDGHNGFFAKDPEGWSCAIKRLLGDSEMRKRFGRAGREIVERQYSLATHGPRLAELIAEIGEQT